MPRTARRRRLERRPGRADRRFVAHTIARSTASRSSSVPCVMSTTSRMPARIAAGRSPFHVWSRTSTIAVPGRGPPDELGQAERVGLLHLGRQDEHVDRAETRVDQELFGRGGRLHPTDVIRLDLQHPRHLLAEGLGRPDGDDARVGHRSDPDDPRRAGRRPCPRSRSPPRSPAAGGPGRAAPSSPRTRAATASSGSRSSVSVVAPSVLRPVVVSIGGFWTASTLTLGISATVKSVGSTSTGAWARPAVVAAAGDRVVELLDLLGGEQLVERVVRDRRSLRERRVHDDAATPG